MRINSCRNDAMMASMKSWPVNLEYLIYMFSWTVIYLTGRAYTLCEQNIKLNGEHECPNQLPDFGRWGTHQQDDGAGGVSRFHEKLK